MLFLTHYASLLGPILLAADETGLTGLWFEGQKYFPSFLGVDYQEKETPILTETVRWLDVYFSGKDPGFLPPLHPQGSPLPADGMGHSFDHSSRPDDDLRRNCPTTGRLLRAGRGRRGGAQSHIHPHSLPPGGGQRRQSDRLRRRRGAQGPAASAGRRPIKKHKGEKS